jgi:hypothetical protein
MRIVVVVVVMVVKAGLLVMHVRKLAAETIGAAWIAGMTVVVDTSNPVEVEEGITAAEVTTVVTTGVVEGMTVEDAEDAAKIVVAEMYMFLQVHTSLLSVLKMHGEVVWQVMSWMLQ